MFDLNNHQSKVIYSQGSKKPMQTWRRDNYAVVLWGELTQAQRNMFNNINTVLNYSAFPVFYVIYRRYVENLFFLGLLNDGLISQARYDYLTTEPPRGIV